MNNKISIAMATYNGAKFIREQLDSLYSQTRIPDEVIVCDDCSNDDTIDILDEYHNKYGLIYYINSTPLGVNKNFYKAIGLCSGKYICICDQDDIWMPNKVATLLNAIKVYDDSQLNCVSSQTLHINALGEQIYIRKQSLLDSDGWQETLLTGGRRSQGCTMIINSKLKERVLQLYDSLSWADSIMYDAFIAYVAAIEGNKKNLAEPLMYYRHHENNVIGKLPDHHSSIIKRICALPIYYPFISSKLINIFSNFYILYRDEITCNNLRIFLKKTFDLNRCNSIIKGLWIISSMPIPSKLKIKVCVLTPLNWTFRKMFKR